VTVKITSKDQIFEATATVLYSRPTMGMAVAFREVKPLFRSMLKDWLQESVNQQNQKPSIDNLKLSGSIPSGDLMSQNIRRSPRIPFIAVAQTAIRTEVRSWKLPQRSDKAIEDLSRDLQSHCSRLYYGRYYRSALYSPMRQLDRDLTLWAAQKYKKLRKHLRRASHWLSQPRARSSAAKSY
jgi:hypothetical protein